MNFPPKECKRTQGVSTTNLVGRLDELFVRPVVFIIFSSGCCCSARSTCKLEAKNTRWITLFVPLPSLRHEIMIIGLCKYIRLQIAKSPGRPKGLYWHEHRGGGTLPMDRTLPVLANNPKAPRVFQRWGWALPLHLYPLIPSTSVQQGPKKGDRIVYVAGAFDLFHIGHLAFLEKCREHGDYLIVGLHTDPVVNRWQKGPLATSSGTRGPTTRSWTCTRERSPPWPTAVSMRS